VNGRAAPAAGPAHRRQAAITAPTRLVVRRSRRGWIVGLLGAGLKIVLWVLAATVTLAVLAGTIAALWWAGDAQIPIVVLVCWSVALAGGGFALGRSSRVYARLPHLPEGPDQLTWPPGPGRMPTGLVWEQDAAVITGPAEPGGGENCP
jgi:hypothetical protein